MLFNSAYTGQWFSNAAFFCQESYDVFSAIKKNLTKSSHTDNPESYIETCTFIVFNDGFT